MLFLLVLALEAHWGPFKNHDFPTWYESFRSVN